MARKADADMRARLRAAGAGEVTASSRISPGFGQAGSMDLDGESGDVGMNLQEGNRVQESAHRHALSMLLAVLTGLTLYRAWVIVDRQLPLFFDEAQYWIWSRSPDWGYYSKPPMVAWVIRLFSVFGDSELAVRLGTLVLHPLTAVLIHALGCRMFGVRAGLAAAVVFISLPLVGFNSLFMTTDAPLFFFWGLAVLALWLALTKNRWRYWLLLGMAVGLGLLSKYSMAIFIPSTALVLCLPAYRRHWRNPRLYAAGLLALLVFLPNLWWNAQMDFVSFRHTVEISRLGQHLFHPAALAGFAGAQFACMGPIACILMLGALLMPSTWRDARSGFLAALTLPFLGLIALQAYLAKANANWAAPAYFAGVLLIVAQHSLHERRRRWLTLCIVVTNLGLLSAFYHYQALADAAGVQLSRKSDPYARLRGWPEIGAAVGQMLARQRDATLAVLTRDEYALLTYYVRPHPDNVRIWNPEGRRQNHFHLTADAAQGVGSSFFFATRTPMGEASAKSFERWTVLGSASVQLYPDEALVLYLYRGDGFRGYAP
jgi:uncharacterized membrane protein